MLRCSAESSPRTRTSLVIKTAPTESFNWTVGQIARQSELPESDKYMVKKIWHPREKRKKLSMKKLRSSLKQRHTRTSCILASLLVKYRSDLRKTRKFPIKTERIFFKKKLSFPQSFLQKFWLHYFCTSPKAYKSIWWASTTSQYYRTSRPTIPENLTFTKSFENVEKRILRLLWVWYFSKKRAKLFLFFPFCVIIEWILSTMPFDGLKDDRIAVNLSLCQSLSSNQTPSSSKRNRSVREHTSHLLTEIVLWIQVVLEKVSVYPNLVFTGVYNFSLKKQNFRTKWSKFFWKFLCKIEKKGEMEKRCELLKSKKLKSVAFCGAG